MEEVYPNELLTNVAIAYMQSTDAFAATQVFPIVPVEMAAGRYTRYAKGDWLRLAARKRAPATESAGGGWRQDNSQFYVCEPISVHKDVDDWTRKNTRGNLDRDATRYVTQQLLIARDRLFAEVALAAGVWANEWNGGDEFTPWDQATSDPIADIDRAKLVIAESTGFVPNALVLTPDVEVLLKNHSTVLERIKYTQPGVVSRQLLASLLGLEKVVVPYGVIDTGPEMPDGSASDVSFIAGENMALLLYVEKAASIMTPSAGYTFAWTGLAQNNEGIAIKVFRMEELEADRVEGTIAVDIRIVAADCGLLMTDIASGS